MATALLVIDVQESLCTGTFAAHDIDRVLAAINASIVRARAAGVQVLFVQHEQDNDPLFRFGSPGWQLASGLLAEPEDDDLVMYMYERLEREGRTDIRNMPLVHSAMSEDISFRRVLRLARYVEGAAVYFVHVSAGAGVASYRRSLRA